MSTPLLLLLRRRGCQKEKGLRSDDTGLLDTLTNVVGVLALITSLLSIFAAAGSLTIQAPMARKSEQGYYLLQVNSAGIWDLQPALTRMLSIDQERVAAVKRCGTLPLQSKQNCNTALDGWFRQEQLGPIRLSVSHNQGSLQRVGPPTVSLDNLSMSGSWLDIVLAKLARDNKALFVVLENDGFETYRVIKSKAQNYGVRLGWEPWNSNQSVNFWSSAGRSLTVQ